MSIFTVVPANSLLLSYRRYKKYDFNANTVDDNYKVDEGGRKKEEYVWTRPDGGDA